MEQVSEEFKKHVFSLLSSILLDVMEKGEIKIQDSQAAASFILKNVEDMKIKDEFYAFMERLSSKWDIFIPINIKIKKEIEDHKQKLLLNKINTNLVKLGAN
jgi:hypothetical protein